MGSGCGGCPAFLYWGESPRTNCNRCMGRRKIVRGVGLRRLSGVFYFGASRRGQIAPVILSDRRESKDLRTDLAAEVSSVRRSFGALRLLRMTRHGQNKTGGHLRRDAPTLSSYHAHRDVSTINGQKVPESPFYTKIPEAFCDVFRLVKWHMPW